MHRQDKQCSQPMYKACGTQSHHSLIPKASGHCTGPRRMEQGLLFLSWLFSLQNVALPLETALPLGFWAPLGNAVLQRRFHGCVTAVTVLEPALRAMEGSTEAMSLCRAPQCPQGARPARRAALGSGSSRRSAAPSLGTPSPRLLTRLRNSLLATP